MNIRCGRCSIISRSNIFSIEFNINMSKPIVCTTLWPFFVFMQHELKIYMFLLMKIFFSQIIFFKLSTTYASLKPNIVSRTDDFSQLSTDVGNKIYINKLILEL